MAGIRFIHADYLRLGTPITGLDQSPAWLQKLTAGATRQAVLNVIEAAVTHEVDFIFIAGAVTESQDDLPSVVAWLGTQLSALRRSGIQVVTVADTPVETRALSQISDVVLQREQLLSVATVPGGALRLTGSDSVEATAQLVLTASSVPVRNADVLHYQASPTYCPAGTLSRVDRDGHTTVSAGATQAVSPNETWECGSVLCEVDTSEQIFRVQMLHTDVVRFVSERLNFSQQTIPGAIVTEILRASDAIQNRVAQTVIMDWVLRCDVMVTSEDVEGLAESVMLTTLRDLLDAGHRGVWPRAVRFSEDSTLKVSSGGETVVEELIDVAHGPVSTVAVDLSESTKVCLAGRHGLPENLLHGISLVARVA